MADACRATLEGDANRLSLFSGWGVAQALLRYRLRVPPSGSVPELPYLGSRPCSVSKAL